MVKHFVGSIALLAAVTFFAGCGSSSSSSSDSNSSVSSASTEPSIPIPPDSIFAKLKVGEERDQVYAAIGQPTSSGSPYQTGKAFIPFHYGGGDDMRFQAHYKGVGVLTFGNDSAYTSGWSVVDVHYDPSDAGY